MSLASPGHVLAVATADAFARNPVLIPVKLGVACLVGSNSLGAVLERGAVLGPGGT